MNIQLASALLRGQWLIDPSYAMQSLPMVENIIQGKLMVEREAIPIKKVGLIGGSSKGKSERYIAVTTISGPMMKNDQDCGPAGMATIGRNLRMLDADPHIAAHVIVADTPGGTVDGTEALGNIIKGLKKPNVGLVDGLCASAGLWALSNTNEMMATTELDEIGSVGVLLSFYDFDPMWEKEGIKRHTIVSSLSPDKVKMWEDLRAGKYDDYRKMFLDPIAVKFQQVIRQNFPNVKEEHLTGKIFHARDLIGIMIKSIGTLDEAIARASELANEAETRNQAATRNQQPETSNQTPVTQNSISMKNFPKLFAILALTELASDEGFSSLSEDQLEAIEAALPSEDAADLSLQIQQATQTITERDERISTLETELAELRTGPAEKPAAAVSATDKGKTDANAPFITDDMPLDEAIERVTKEYGI